jgi:hypothetical protein
MQIKFDILPWLCERLGNVRIGKEAAAEALARLEQMDEFFELFITLAEISPRYTAQLLDQHILPRPAGNCDRSSLRWFYKCKTAALALTDFIEELRLYCQSRWIDTDQRATATQHLHRLEILWKYFFHSEQPETMLFRLPPKLRKEVSYLRG